VGGGGGAVIGLVSVAYVRGVAWADRNRPRGWLRIAMPVLVLGLVGAASIVFPQLLGNGRDVANLAFGGHVAPMLLVALMFLRPAATISCLGSGAPGGLFTPSLAAGAMLGACWGYRGRLCGLACRLGCSRCWGRRRCWRRRRRGRFRRCVDDGADGVRAGAIVPLMLVVATSTLVARTIEARSVYDARLSDEEVRQRQRIRDGAPAEAGK